MPSGSRTRRGSVARSLRGSRTHCAAFPWRTAPRLWKCSTTRNRRLFKPIGHPSSERRSQCSITATAYACSSPVRGRPFSMWCHLARHPLQHVAVACWATNTGCPRKGVCLPSFRGSAGANRCAMKSAAWARTVSIPLDSRYSRSRTPNRNRRRNGDRDKALNKSSRSRAMLPAPFVTQGSVNATYVSLDFVPSFPPPAAITTYCFPRTEYVLGVA